MFIVSGSRGSPDGRNKSKQVIDTYRIPSRKWNLTCKRGPDDQVEKIRRYFKAIGGRVFLGVNFQFRHI